MQIANPKAFTLTELLVVIGIITILIAILVPVTSRVRQAVYAARTQALISSLSAGIEAYRQDFGAYPGPISNNDFGSGGTLNLAVAATAGFVTTPAPTSSTITGTENLVLGLCGGLTISGTTVTYNPGLVGKGPKCLNTVVTYGNKAYRPYIEATSLSWRTDASGMQTGQFVDDAASANDSVIPEFVDCYSDPMPILYLRARPGAPGINNSGIITQGGTSSQYDLNQILGYTSTAIGVGKQRPTAAPQGYVLSYNDSTPHGLKSVSGSNRYPFDQTGTVIYFTNSAITPVVAKQKDGYILISAGTDRIYGTTDDLTNFGSVP